MAEANTACAGLTLPPKVEGRVSGHLVMKVDEVLWARKPPGEVSAVVMWWGGEEPTTFRPSDVAENAVKRKNAGVIYEIRTTLPLFEKYLCKSGSLEIAMADRYGMPIGCVSVPNLKQMIKSHPYQNYYPIVNNFGNRIGDLHVSFNLRMLANVENIPITLPTTPNKQGVKTKDLKRLSSVKNKQPALGAKSKEEKTKTNEKVSKKIHVASEFGSNLPKVDYALENENVSHGTVDLVHQESQCRRVSPTTNIISQILEQGTRLRDAMAASVMEDCAQLDFQNLYNRDVLAQNSKKSQVTVGHNQPQLEAGSVIPQIDRSVNPVVEKKVMDYLSGKPMSEKEEKEALAALRSMTPTKDILETVVPEKNQTLVQQDSSREEVIDSLCDSSEVITKITDYSPASSSKHLYDVDSQLFLQVNCLRITIQSLVFNSVGIKRLRPPMKKKVSRCQSSTALQPPGITYFIEYKFPLASSRPWESIVRYCSKRFSGNEVSFGDRTVHNLPTSWRSSLSNESTLGSLISSLGIKVCARHLHQRIPIVLGAAELNTVKPLFDSTNLRHDFDVPVIAADCLPVAQLRLCIELGRDRIHFGGLLDPENNSLGLKSPKPLNKDSNSSSKTAAKIKPGCSVTTVTRNITPIPSSVSKSKHKLSVHQAAQADKVIKQIVRNVSLNRYQASESSSAPSTGRPHLKPMNANLYNCSWNSTYAIDYKSNPGLNAPMINQPVKHEMALNILEVFGMNLPHSFAGGDRGFYVTYRFPVFDVTQNNRVDWQPFQTELSVDANGKWKRPQYRIHSVILYKPDSFHSFLKHAAKMCGGSDLVFVTFLLYARYFGDEVKDKLIAEATLPLSTILTLEDAYLEASQKDPNFSSSSCSSVILDLLFKCSPGNQIREFSKGVSNLRIKLDYRHSNVSNLNGQENMPRSRGDSVSENIPHRFLGIEEYPELLKESAGSTYGLELGGSPLSVPNWARSADKQLPVSSKLQDHQKCEKKAHDLNNVMDHTEVSTSPMETLHATWVPIRDIPQGNDLIVDCPYGHRECKTTSTTISCAKYNTDLPDEISRSSLHLSSQDWRTQNDSYVDPVCSVDFLKTSGSKHAQVGAKKKKDVATSPSSSLCQMYSSSKGTSPLPHSKSVSNVHDKATCTEKDLGREDKAQQVVFSIVNEECQTTPRENKVVSRRDAEVITDFCELSSERDDLTKSKTIAAANINPCGSIDDFEVIKVDLDQPHEAKLSVHDGNCTLERKKEDSIQSVPMQIVPCVDLDESSDNMVHSFSATVGVECALHLQSTVSDAQEKLPSFVFVSLNPCEIDSHVPSLTRSTPIFLSPAVLNNSEPEWHWHTKVELPSDMLYLNKKRLIFKVWQTFKVLEQPCVQDLDGASLIGFAALDLTVLSVGLPLLSGWYNIMDFTGACQGQIKLSVQPLNSIPKTINLPVSRDDNQSQTTLSMFLAHCVYKEFPSHVVQFPDMYVQKVDAQTVQQSMSAVLNSYQDIIQHCQRQNTEMSSKDTSETLMNEGDVAGPSEKSTSVEHNDGSVPSRTKSSSVDVTIHNSATYSDADIQKDPSQVLREKLSELDTITKCIKARLLNQNGSSGEAVEQSSHAAFSHANYTKIVGQSIYLEEKRSHASACSSNSALDSSGKSLSDNLSRAKENKSSQKQRRMWEKQEDLIDFGALHIDCESDYEASPPAEDLSDWLSESALQQVFNPFLFNDLLNNMNSDSGVRVIELDDTETSDENLNLATVASHETADKTMHEEHKKASLKISKRRCRKGDETFRKEIPLCDFSKSEQGTPAGVSVCDTDSGVDVEFSANFNPSASVVASRIQHHIAGARATSVERDQSSSCSHSSSRQQSTLPSSASASATPTDSPQHSRYDNSHQSHALSNVQVPSRCGRQPRKN